MSVIWIKSARIHGAQGVGLVAGSRLLTALLQAPGGHDNRRQCNNNLRNHFGIQLYVFVFISKATRCFRTKTWMESSRWWCLKCTRVNFRSVWLLWSLISKLEPDLRQVFPGSFITTTHVSFKPQVSLTWHAVQCKSHVTMATLSIITIS